MRNELTLIKYNLNTKVDDYMKQLETLIDELNIKLNVNIDSIKIKHNHMITSIYFRYNVEYEVEIYYSFIKKLFDYRVRYDGNECITLTSYHSLSGLINDLIKDLNN